MHWKYPKINIIIITPARLMRKCWFEHFNRIVNRNGLGKSAVVEMPHSISSLSYFISRNLIILWILLPSTSWYALNAAVPYNVCIFIASALKFALTDKFLFDCFFICIYIFIRILSRLAHKTVWIFFLCSHLTLSVLCALILFFSHVQT